MYPVLFLMGLWVRKREEEEEEKRERKQILCLRLFKVCHQRMDTKRNIYVLVSHELKKQQSVSDNVENSSSKESISLFFLKARK